MRKLSAYLEEQDGCFAGGRLAFLDRDGKIAQQALRVIRLHLAILTVPQHGESRLHENAMPGMCLPPRIFRAVAIVEGPKREHDRLWHENRLYKVGRQKQAREK